ncbi:MAG TPA: quinone oxidoreductase [Rhizomicrobium sp.]|jgi:NADPH2:quinone reductase|nr:quinone oxidoreductase [Rhizomicrobium sp.]
MKAIRISKTGGPEVLELKDIELPPPARGQVRVKHTAIGVNFIDTYQRSGLYPIPVPGGLGLEAAGTVEALGDGVTSLKIGDRVGYCSGPPGAYAEANNVPADRLVKLPDGVSDEDAAAAMLKGMTAQYLLKRTYAVKPGQTILWHAAAGGVGLIACQWAKHLGVTVIGTVGSEEKIALAKSHGCDHVINTSTENWVARLRTLTKDEGVPVVYDSVGKDTWNGSLDCLAIRGMMVSFGNASGPVPAFDPIMLGGKGSLYLTRPSLMHYTRTTQELQETADDLFDVIAKGVVKIEIRQRFALADARAAHEALHSRNTTGATILLP